MRQVLRYHLECDNCIFRDNSSICDFCKDAEYYEPDDMEDELEEVELDQSELEASEHIHPETTEDEQ